MRYTARDETRREHVAELLLRLGLKPFTTDHYHYRAMVSWLEPAAAQTTRGLVFAQAVVAELHKRRIVLPPVAVTGRLCAEAAIRAQRTVFARLTDGLDTDRRRQLASCWNFRDGSPYSSLAWLCTSPGPPTATLTEEIFVLHDRLIGSFFTKSKHKYEYTFAEQGRAINDKVRLHAKVGAALVVAIDKGHDASQTMEAVLSWDLFSQSVNDAERLARAEHFDPLEMLTDHYASLRRYSPMLLETFEFKAAPAAAALLHAVQTLRHLNRNGVRTVPTDAPTGFIRLR